MLPTENRWTKKRKAEEEAAIVPPANVVMQFQSDDGVKAGAYHALSCVCVSRLPFRQMVHAALISCLQDHSLVYNTM